MNLSPYPKYKSSGVEWLGKLPDHWEVKRLGSIFRSVDEPGDDQLAILSVSIHDGVSDKELDENEMDRKVTRSDDRSKYKKVLPGDLVYNMMRAWQGGFGTVTVPGMVSPAYIVARPTTQFSTAFVEGLLRTPQAIEQMRRYSQGVTDFRLRLYWEEFKTIRIAQPPPDEQIAIASFLDRETAKIDALVAEQKRLIELLKEKRQAVISHAVTKGLNPNAKMKPSGIDWLGDVPEGWEEFPLGSLMRLKHGYAFDGSYFTDAGDYILLTPGNFHERGGFRSKEPEKYYLGDDFPREFILEQGQLLVAMTEQAPGLLGSALFVPNQGIYLHNQRVGLVQGLRQDRLNEVFLFYLFNSSRYRAEVSITSTGAKVRHTSPGRMLNVRVWLPPLEEQISIVAAVDKELNDIDLLNCGSQRAIDLLQERRSALISAAVTGQIDVRGLVPSEAA